MEGYGTKMKELQDKIVEAVRSDCGIEISNGTVRYPGKGGKEFEVVCKTLDQVDETIAAYVTALSRSQGGTTDPADKEGAVKYEKEMFNKDLKERLEG
jgi:hypothetical protein